MKKELSAREQYRIAGLILMFIIAVFYFSLVVHPQLKRLIILTAQEKALRHRIRSVEELNKDKESLDKDIQKIKDRLDYFEEQLPSQVNIPQILESLVTIAKNCNVNFTAVEPQKIEEIRVGEEGGRTYLEIPIKLRLEAGYHELGRFINRIENYPRFMKVNKIKIEERNLNSKRHSADLTVNAFALSEAHNGPNKK
ncbi:MAG: type 4a pilus biogenesis protein PilO [Candidatus Omnitrophica bacterium]|nr:type 4a pilus biogenesis protein PilO [Candidatus Omnitrophota bacterium]MBU1924424.1 type 4a pilus biogenesis protein PilO [Candidatus Omnitrophota bacterium]